VEKRRQGIWKSCSPANWATALPLGLSESVYIPVITLLNRLLKGPNEMSYVTNMPQAKENAENNTVMMG
jgi:hypothetical protein